MHITISLIVLAWRLPLTLPLRQIRWKTATDKIILWSAEMSAECCRKPWIDMWLDEALAETLHSELEGVRLL